jgi:hypothetical protein
MTWRHAKSLPDELRNGETNEDRNHDDRADEDDPLKTAPRLVCAAARISAHKRAKTALAFLKQDERDEDDRCDDLENGE